MAMQWEMSCPRALCCTWRVWMSPMTGWRWTWVELLPGWRERWVLLLMRQPLPGALITYEMTELLSWQRHANMWNSSRCQFMISCWLFLICQLCTLNTLHCLMAVPSASERVLMLTLPWSGFQPATISWQSSPHLTRTGYRWLTNNWATRGQYIVLYSVVILILSILQIYDSEAASFSEWMQIRTTDDLTLLQAVANSPALMCMEASLPEEATVRVRSAPNGDAAEIRQIGKYITRMQLRKFAKPILFCSRIVIASWMKESFYNLLVFFSIS